MTDSCPPDKHVQRPASSSASTWRVQSYVIARDITGRLLLVRGDDARTGRRYGFLHTALRKGESPRDAALRKWFERTGVILGADDLGETPDHVNFEVNRGDSNVVRAFYVLRGPVDPALLADNGTEVGAFAATSLPSSRELSPVVAYLLFATAVDRKVSFNRILAPIRTANAFALTAVDPQIQTWRVGVNALLAGPNGGIWMEARSHAMPYAPNRWGLAGGDLVGDELPNEGMARKVQAETGLRTAKTAFEVPALVLFDLADQPHVRVIFAPSKALRADSLEVVRREERSAWREFALDAALREREVLPFFPLTQRLLLEEVPVGIRGLEL